MESLPLIAKSRIVPNLDVTSLIREIFRTELESYVPPKKLSENLRKSLECERVKEDFEGQKSFRSVNFLENLPDEKGKLLDYAEKVLEAYGKHEEALGKIAKVELNIMETQAIYLRNEELIKQNDFLRDLLKLKKRPLMRPYDPEYVEEYKLLRGDSNLPPKHEAELDFRIKDYRAWGAKLSSYGDDNLFMKCTTRRAEAKIPRKKVRKARMRRPKGATPKEERPNLEVFRAEPASVCFTDYTPGCAYSCHIIVRNTHTKPMKFVLKSLSAESPFKVEMYGTETTRILPGLGFKLLVTFHPRNLDDQNENVTLLIEDGSKLVIRLASYLEPPVLKTHEDVNEFTKNNSERIRSSYIDCGACFPGDSKVTKIRFYSFGGTGEFFLMSQENWSNWHIDCLTPDNFTELSPFRFYPSYFKVDKNQAIDLYVEFKPPAFGLHSDNIIIVCDNGEVRNLDILGDGVSWNRSFISFEEGLEKDFPPYINDDHRAPYYLDMGITLATGRTERTFSITNNSDLPFEFRWEKRDVFIAFKGQEEPGKLSTDEVKIEPCSQIFEPHTSRSFLVSVDFQKKPVAQYRTVLSLYVIGLPYQSIEQGNTIIRPSLPGRRFKTGSEFGEEDNLLPSPELSYQDTYESIQEGMKASAEIKYQQQFPATVCRKQPVICSIPLKKSKTFSNIGGSVDACTCSATRTSEALETVKNYEYDSYPRKPNITELGSDLLWDFVDVLVDEVELWVEVVPIVVTLEPWIINLYEDVRINEPPVLYEVYVNNHNNSSIACRWFESAEKQKLSSEGSKKEEMSTLYDPRDVDKSERTESVKGVLDLGEDAEGDRFSGNSAQSPDEYQITCYAAQKCNINGETVPDASANKYCDIKVDPSGVFNVPPHSRFRCVVSVSASEPGIINRVLNLTVPDDEPMRLYIVGKVPDREISVFPPILDFGVRRRGTRYTKHFKIKNESKEPVEWKVEQYKFDYAEQILTGPLDEEGQSSMKYLKGTLEESGCTVESYKLDARKPGMQTNILKFDTSSSAYAKTRSRYVVVLADVQTPKLAIEAPRFENAILAPSRTMYVGQTITQNIILKNMKNFATTFIWGYQFGCHCRKLRINMRPKLCVVGGLKNTVVRVDITPLEEGIVEHCYIPCFFSRNVDPVLLSVVGVIESVRVMFEVTKENLNLCNASVEEKASVLKISWPIKNFDPTIGMSHIPESNILDFVCHCDQVDAEYVARMDTRTNYAEEDEIPAEDPGEIYYPEEEAKKPCVRKYYTPERMMELRNEILRKKGIDLEETAGEEEARESLIKEIDTESGIMVEYTKRGCADLIYYAASELVFLEVSYRTVSVKHFVIRNLSPISTHFSLKVRYFGKVEQAGNDRVQQIKNRVFGLQKGEFEDGLIYGQPLLITTSPSEGVIEGWKSLRISVFAYGNTWGEYRDFVVCDVEGMPPFVMKVFVQLSGHPVLFPMFKTSLSEIPILRFNTVKYKSRPVTRRIGVRNTSSIPITVTWIVFLTSPVPPDTKEDPFNLCLDLYTDKESEDHERTTKSSRNYLSKNTSGSVPFFDAPDVAKSYSYCTGINEIYSGKKDETKCCGSDLTPTTVPDSTKPEIQLLENFGRVDLHVFQISPRELDLEPYSEQKLTITFDPNYRDQTLQLQDYEAVVTGCVRLKQEHSHYPNIYQRPCGKDYVSKLLYMSGSVEKPLLQFDISKSDLRYVLNANEVLKTNESRKTNKYIVRNRCQTSVLVSLKLEPGEVFSIKKIGSLTRVLPKDADNVTIEPGCCIEIHLEMTVTLDRIMDIHKKFKLQGRKKRKRTTPTDSSEMILEGGVVPVSDSDDENPEKPKFYDIGSSAASYSSYELVDPNSKFGARPNDSFVMIENRSKPWKGSSNTDENALYSFKREPEEYCGESVSPTGLEHSGPDQHIKLSYTVKENLVFEQAGLVKQVLTPEIQVFFPSLKLNPAAIDFGNVHIGETATRYTSVINLTQFPTLFVATASGGLHEFAVRPKRGYLPAANYECDVGVELEVEFSPNEPGYFKNTFKIFGNEEMEFEFFVLTVFGFGTWNEKYKYPKIESQTKLPPIVLPFVK